MEEEGEAVGDAGSVAFSEAKEFGAGGLIDGVVDEVVWL